MATAHALAPPSRPIVVFEPPKAMLSPERTFILNSTVNPSTLENSFEETDQPIVSMFPSTEGAKICKIPAGFISTVDCSNGSGT